MNIVIATDRTLERLNRLLHGELLVMETYCAALSAFVETRLEMALELDTCLVSHRGRAFRLRELINNLGGLPTDSSASFRGIAQALADVESFLGDDSTIFALEDAEEQELHLYRNTVSDLDVPARAVVKYELLPQQMRTHASVQLIRQTSRAC